jgi:hypothetical protein
VRQCDALSANFCDIDAQPERQTAAATAEQTLQHFNYFKSKVVTMADPWGVPSCSAPQRRFTRP